MIVTFVKCDKCGKKLFGFRGHPESATQETMEEFRELAGSADQKEIGHMARREFLDWLVHHGWRVSSDRQGDLHFCRKCVFG